MPYGRATRRISATPRARSGMKLITSAEATTSKVPSENGSACASATRKSARLATGCRRGDASCARAGGAAAPRAGGGGVAQGGVGPRPARGGGVFDDGGRNRAGPAADVEPRRLPGRGEPVEEHRAHGAAPAPHELIVGGAVVEGRAGFGHAPASVAHRRDLSARAPASGH